MKMPKFKNGTTSLNDMTKHTIYRMWLLELTYPKYKKVEEYMKSVYFIDSPESLKEVRRAYGRHIGAFKDKRITDLHCLLVHQWRAWAEFCDSLWDDINSLNAEKDKMFTWILVLATLCVVASASLLVLITK